MKPQTCSHPNDKLIIRSRLVTVLDGMRKDKTVAQCALCSRWVEITMGDCFTIANKQTIHRKEKNQ
jgi:hypothetical protein